MPGSWGLGGGELAGARVDVVEVVVVVVVVLDVVRQHLLDTLVAAMFARWGPVPERNKKIGKTRRKKVSE